MKNIRVTNMNNGSSIVITKQQFKDNRTIFSEDSMYAETDEPLTALRTRLLGRQGSMAFQEMLYFILSTGGNENEVNRTATV